MSLFNVFDISGSGMRAQTVRLNTIASNLANADNITGSAEAVYRAKQVVFETVLQDQFEGNSGAGVRVSEIVTHNTEPTRRYEPDNSMADENGYVYQANVNPIEEMANMISASRSFQNNVDALNTTKQLLLATLRLGE